MLAPSLLQAFLLGPEWVFLLIGFLIYPQGGLSASLFLDQLLVCSTCIVACYLKKLRRTRNPLMFDPLHQFEITTLFPLSIQGIDISFTNSAFFMVLAVLTTTFFLIGGIYRAKAVPGPWQSLVEMSHGFIMNLIDETIGVKGRP